MRQDFEVKPEESLGEASGLPQAPCAGLSHSTHASKRLQLHVLLIALLVCGNPEAITVSSAVFTKKKRGNQHVFFLERNHVLRFLSLLSSSLSAMRDRATP